MYNMGMTIYTDLLHLLRMFSLRRNNAQVTLQPFQDYLHRYARHFLQQKQDLAVLLEISLETLLSELKKIQDEGDIEITTDKSNTTIIFVPYFHVDNMHISSSTPTFLFLFYPIYLGIFRENS